jgi:hypothetical protein
MGEWKVQVSVRVTPAMRAELEQCAAVEKRTLANFGKIILEWAFEQFKVAGSTERLLKYKVRPLGTGTNNRRAPKPAGNSDGSPTNG